MQPLDARERLGSGQQVAPVVDHFENPPGQDLLLIGSDYAFGLAAC